MKLYELSYLVTPELSEVELKDLSQKMSAFITKNEGKIEKTGDLFKKKLGHPIEKNEEAFFGVFEFRYSPEKIRGLEEKLRAGIKILRYTLLVKREFNNAIVTRKTIESAVENEIGLDSKEEHKKSMFEKIIPDFFKGKSFEEKTEVKKEESPEELIKEEKSKPQKVELKEIDKKIEEILND